MNTGDVIIFIQEIAYLLGVLGFFLVYSIVRGRQSVINLIVGLYFALLISLQFPYYTTFLGTSHTGHNFALGKVIIFVIFTLIATILITRLMPEEYKEKKFESFPKKIMLAAGGTILIMLYSFHVLPITEFVTPGSPIQALFAPDQYQFWWLLIPLIALYLN